MNAVRPGFEGATAILGVATGNPFMVIGGTLGAGTGAGKAITSEKVQMLPLPHNQLKDLNKEEGKRDRISYTMPKVC